MTFMHTVIQPPEHLRAAKAAQMTDDEMSAAVLEVADDPQGGDVLEGTRGFASVASPARARASRAAAAS